MTLARLKLSMNEKFANVEYSTASNCIPLNTISFVRKYPTKWNVPHDDDRTYPSHDTKWFEFERHKFIFSGGHGCFTEYLNPNLWKFCANEFDPAPTWVKFRYKWRVVRYHATIQFSQIHILLIVIQYLKKWDILSDSKQDIHTELLAAVWNPSRRAHWPNV